jgi:hypothetical protein
MVHVGCRKIPEKYIVKRWTQDARDCLPEHLMCYQKDVSVQLSKTFRHNIIYVKALENVKLANHSVGTFQYAIRKLDELQKNLNTLITEGSIFEDSNDNPSNYVPSEPHQERENDTRDNKDSVHEEEEDNQNGTDGNVKESQDLLPPEKTASKGRPKTKRLKISCHRRRLLQMEPYR